MAMKKKTLKIILIGHVDHGKSTLIGRLLLDTNSLPREKISEIRKISRELGKETELAFLTDQLKEERERSITIDTTQTFFKTRKRNCVIIDAPGHVEFIKNMITGASLAEAALLLIDINEGIREQTRRHAYVIRFLGIESVIVLFNKVDLVDYKEERFREVKSELLKLLEALGIKPSFLIPVSAKKGVNIIQRSKKTSWYNGPPLLKTLDLLKVKPETANRPLRFPIQDVYDLSGEKVIVGKIVSGTIKKGQDVISFPALREAKVKSIKVFGKSGKVEGRAGENIGLVLDKAPFAERGEVITRKGDRLKPSDRFKGKIFWMFEEPLQINESLILRCATQEVKCVVEKIEKRINSSTLKVMEEDAGELKTNEVGEVILRTEKPIAIEKFSFIEELGRFVVERGYNPRGAGIIT